MIYPSDQATGDIENPWAMFVSSVSSAIILLTVPMCPFIAPCKHRLWSSSQSVEIAADQELPQDKRQEGMGQAE